MSVRHLYTALLYLITPLILLRLLWRGLSMPEYRQRWRERFGHVRPAQPVAAWVHAVSVGESLAALPLIRALIERHGPGRVLVTTTTPTGSMRVAAALGDTVQHCYAPYDLPHVVARFIARMQPGRLIVMETELWPNLFHAVARRGIPLHIVNARLSPHSFRGYGRVRGFAAETLGACTGILAQSPADAERFVQLGAAPDRVHAVGNLKFDQAVPEAQIRLGRDWRRRLGEQRPVWAAVSTHEGEERAALDAHRRLRRRHPEALLLLVPRHPQRFDDIERLILREGWACRRRSAAVDADGELDTVEVLLGDSMGEMFAYLQASDLAFVGGSLVPVGGHNVLEPAAIGRPVLFGPHRFNSAEISRLLLEAGAAFEVRDAGALAEWLQRLFGDVTRRNAAGERAAEVVAAVVVVAAVLTASTA